MASKDDYDARIKALNSDPGVVKALERARSSSWFTPSQGIGFSEEGKKYNNDIISKIQNQLSNLLLQSPTDERTRIQLDLQNGFASITKKPLGELPEFEKLRKYGASSFFNALSGEEFNMVGNALREGGFIDKMPPLAKQSIAEAFLEARVKREYERQISEKAVPPPTFLQKLQGKLGLGPDYGDFNETESE